MTPTPALHMDTYTLTHTALGSGRLCLCSFPGSKMSARTSDQSKAAFRHDLEAMYALGMTDMIGLVEPDEYRQMGLVSKDDTDSMPGVFLKSMPVKYLNMPIRDYDIPNNIFLTEWRLVLSYYASVTHGGNILGIHCMGGPWKVGNGRGHVPHRAWRWQGGIHTRRTFSQVWSHRERKTGGLCSYFRSGMTNFFAFPHHFLI
jgi:hypothetical protein